jgi:ribosomal-protein-alanine N-acetyltransferase
MRGLNWIGDLCRTFFGAANDNETQKQQLAHIETDRLVLREIRPEDVQRVYEISNSEKFFYYCFDGSMEAAQDFVTRAIATQTADPKTGRRSDVMLAVCEKGSDVMIGHVAVESVDYIDGIGYEPNFFMDPAYQSTGYGREGVINIMHYGFQEMGIEKYTATVHPDNEPSKNVIQSSGFKKHSDVEMETSKGMEPRELYVLSAPDFYHDVASYKRPLIKDIPPQYLPTEKRSMNGPE